MSIIDNDNSGAIAVVVSGPACTPNPPIVDTVAEGPSGPVESLDVTGTGIPSISTKRRRRRRPKRSAKVQASPSPPFQHAPVALNDGAGLYINFPDVTAEKAQLTEFRRRCSVARHLLASCNVHLPTIPTSVAYSALPAELQMVPAHQESWSQEVWAPGCDEVDDPAYLEPNDGWQ